jgi:hypothetical protein
MEITLMFINCSVYMCDMAVMCIIEFIVATDMFMKFQQELLHYMFSLLDICAMNTYYMLKRADVNSDHFKRNFKDLVIGE